MRWLCWWRPPCVLSEVIVNLKDDPSAAIRGVLWRARGPWFTLRNPVGLKVGQQPAKMDGEAVIHRDNIAFLQVVR